MVHAEEVFIETADVWQLREIRMPIMRFFAPDFVGHLELGRHVKGVLSTGKSRPVRVVPHPGEEHRHLHRFDLYGEPLAWPDSH